MNTNALNALNAIPSKLPSQLTSKKRFVLWRLGEINPKTNKKRKIPHSANGHKCNALDVTNHISFNEALNALNSGKFSGIGFVTGNGINCLDIDNASEIKKPVQDVLNAFKDTWIEVSQSGDGYHVFFEGEPKTEPHDRPHFQLYKQNQFIALTGNQYGAINEINRIDFDSTFPLKFKTKAQAMTPTPKPRPENPEKIDILELAFKARNGQKIKALYEASANSEDDLSLAKLLSFYTHSSVGGGDTQLLEILKNAPFIQLRKAAHKWADYLPRTIKKAVQNIGKTYTPRKTKDKKNFGRRNENGYQMLDDGLHFFIPKENKIIDERITYAPFEIVANTRNEESEEWGMLLRWRDPSGKSQEFLMSNDELAADGKDYRAVMLSLGLKIKPKNKMLLTDYLSEYESKDFLISSNQTGWSSGSYVFPEKTIGKTNVVMLNNRVLKKEYELKSDLIRWQKTVSEKCKGNSLLMLSASMSFASMLLPFTNEESGGLQITGGSSSGKTTAAFVAASVFGNPSKFIKQWRSTSNALEATAASRNDALLILDELSQAEPRDVGETIYMLANGAGKGRMSRNAQLKEIKTWRLLFLSTGEVTLAEHMKTGGKKARAGQETRVIDIPCDIGKYGTFEDIHSAENGADFSYKLKRDCLKACGTASRIFVESLTKQDHDELTLGIDKSITDITKYLLKDLNQVNGQVARVARRFALIATGGLMATLEGITGWDDNSLLESIKKCFQLWLNERGGTGSTEEKRILEKVNYFFERYGNSRFIDESADAPPPHDMAGVRDGDTYFVLPNVFREQMCEGYKEKIVIDVCIKNGLMIKGTDRIKTRKRIKGLGNKWVYKFSI